MYFFKYSPLKAKLKTRSISDREALPYLVALIGLTSLAGLYPSIAKVNGWDVLSGILSFIFAITGIIYAYKCNGGKDGYDLIQKYIVLGWVVSIRCLCGIIPLIIVVYIALHFLGVSTSDTSLFDVTFTALLEVFIYQRIGRHIRDTK